MAEPVAERPYMPDYGVDTQDVVAAAVVVGGGEAGTPGATTGWSRLRPTAAPTPCRCGACGTTTTSGSPGRAGRGRARPPTSRPTRRSTIAVDDTVECLSVEGRASRVEDRRRQDVWIERYLAKYTPLAPDLSADFLRQNLLFELVPERASAVIEREEEFATRATRWRFGLGSPETSSR